MVNPRSNPLLDIQQLQYFVAVAQRGSLSKASEVVALSQPALSRQISNLESRLGRQLFLRTPSGMVLTPAGNALLTASHEIIERLNRLRREILAQEDGYPQTLRLGFPHSSWDEIAAAAAKDIRSLFPASHIEIDQDTSAGLAKKLADNRLDLAVISAYIPAAGLVTHPLLTEQIYLAGPPCSDLNPRIHVPPSELAKLPLISRGGPIEVAFANLRAANAIDAYHLVADCKSEEACVQLVAAGIGFSFLSAPRAHREAASGRLKIAPIKDMLSTWTFAFKGCPPSDAFWQAGNCIREATRRYVIEGRWPNAELRC